MEASENLFISVIRKPNLTEDLLKWINSMISTGKQKGLGKRKFDEEERHNERRK